MGKQDQKYDAWNPGLESEIPSDLLALVTLFRPENSHISHSEAKELAQVCGLDEADLVLFRTERLVVHELLIEVTADLSIPDGPNYEDLGINLRSMVATQPAPISRSACNPLVGTQSKWRSRTPRRINARVAAIDTPPSSLGTASRQPSGTRRARSSMLVKPVWSAMWSSSRNNRTCHSIAGIAPSRAPTVAPGSGVR